MTPMPSRVTSLTMKLVIALTLIITLRPLFAAEESKHGADPFAGAFFPPEMVTMARDRIALTQEQQDAIRSLMEKTQARSDESRKKLEKETAALAALTSQERVDKTALLAQLDKVLDVERELKHLHVGVLVEVKNLLTPEQQSKLRAITKDGGTQLMEAAQKRLMEKMGRVKDGAQKMADSGSDPSDILRTMEQEFKPLMEAGKAVEAEAVLDRALKILSGEPEAKPEPTKSAAPKAKADAPSDQPDEATIKRLTEKVEHISAGARKWAESGRDPSDIRDAMEKKFKPLMGAGKLIEAEAELDRMLKTLGEVLDAKPDSSKEEGKTSSSEAAATLEQVATGFRLAEGPVWDGENLIFSDVFPSEIHKLGADGTVSKMRSDTRKGAGLALDSKGRLLICEVDGFRVTRIEKDGTETTLADSYAGKKLNGPNDLAGDTKDGIYFTDPLFLNKDKREQDKEAVYYISPEGKVLRVADDLEKPNGIALARDGKTLFVADTMQSKLRAYPVKEDGTLGEGRDFGTVPAPDGVRVDMDGKVYAAGKTGIAIWDASGKFLGTIKTPTPPNSLAFGDADRRTMFITTNASVFKIGIDRALKLLTAHEQVVAKASPATSAATPATSAEAVQQRVAAKIERIKEGAHQLAQSGTDPSEILKTMKEKIGPLLGEGKFAEAEPEIDRVLEQLKQGAK